MEIYNFGDQQVIHNSDINGSLYVYERPKLICESPKIVSFNDILNLNCVF